MAGVVELCPIYAGLIRVLAYYDLFEYPLTCGEIHAFLPDPDVGIDELRESLAELVADGKLGRGEGMYFLPHRDMAVVRRRLRMEEQGRLMWRKARLVAGLMRYTPFVRGIFISGQLCRYIADEASDIDYFIVTAPRRLWLVRTLFVTLRRALLFNSRRYFCTNYFVTTENLLIRERNPYVACEVASLKPIYNQELFARFMARNSWISAYYPNFSPERVEIRPGVAGGERLRGMLERMIPSGLADRLDRKLMNLTRSFWRRKFPGLDKSVYDVALRTRPDESRAHPNDQSPRVLELYRNNLRRYGIIDE